ncbi:rhomboid family intramembrane serine protease [Tersicoccus sp. Bi-70]|uniref:rhomboid family intramembrane serine protease n=1 Tax=Tersicoccus sp. Bi-70 TaxID=1897634 RepID=UPI000975BE57|nr:rhomboid family intramembrane serine protease [Tersicoccus sp. Bi-70]OMH31611.1 rhomboid family intramembrane serine protease [Tersicoccus sp. Bi-70]
MPEPTLREELRRHTARVVLPPMLLVALMWVVEIVDVILPLRLDAFGIRPRQLDGLWGVVTAPFLHVGFAHLIANSGAFLVLGVLVGLVSGRFWTVFAGVTVLGGLGTWLIGGSGSVHVGASGVVYGFAAFLLAYGLAARRLGPAVVALVVVLVYGGLAAGVLPLNPFVSWQGHLCGALAGAVVGLVLGRRTRERT